MSSVHCGLRHAPPEQISSELQSAFEEHESLQLNSGTGVGVGVAVAISQVQSASSVHCGLRHAPPEQIKPDSQSAFAEQLSLQDAGGLVGVGVAVATVQVQSASSVHCGLRHAPPEHTSPVSQSALDEHPSLQEAGGGVGVGVNDGVGVGVLQRQSASAVHCGLRHVPPEHTMPASQLAFDVQVSPHCPGAGVGVGVGETARENTSRQSSGSPTLNESVHAAVAACGSAGVTGSDCCSLRLVINVIAPSAIVPTVRSVIYQYFFRNFILISKLRSPVRLLL